MYNLKEFENSYQDHLSNFKKREIDNKPLLLINRLINIKKYLISNNLKQEKFLKKYIDGIKYLMLRLPAILDDNVTKNQITIYEDSISLNTNNNKITHSDALKNWNIHKKCFEKKGIWILDSKILKLRNKSEDIIRKYNQKCFLEIKVTNLVTEDELTVTGQLPLFKKDELFETNRKGFYLSPTGEVQLGNLIIDNKKLPNRLFTLSNCFRQETNYGKFSQGLIRTIEFEKIEIFSYSENDRSKYEHRFMMLWVFNILKNIFKLPIRIIRLAANDTGYSSTVTYDFEVYLPVTKIWMEISSVSNCKDYQILRRNFLTSSSIKNVHTLNGSCLPLGRLIVALIENNIEL